MAHITKGISGTIKCTYSKKIIGDLKLKYFI